MGGKVSANNRGRWLFHERLRETFALVVCSRVNMRGAISNCSCLGWRSGREHEARGSGVIPTKTPAKSDSLEASDERALPADLLSCPAARSRVLLKRALRNPGSVTAQFVFRRRHQFSAVCGVFERVLQLRIWNCKRERLSLDPERMIDPHLWWGSVCSTTAVGCLLFTRGLGGEHWWSSNITGDVISGVATSVDAATAWSLTPNNI